MVSQKPFSLCIHQKFSAKIREKRSNKNTQIMRIFIIFYITGWHLTWSIAEGCLPWWKVETRIAKAWTWFMLTLNWSWSIRARSSHMLDSVSSRLKIIFSLRSQYNQMDVVTPHSTDMIRSFFCHFPAPFGGLRIWCCLCCKIRSAATGSDWTLFGFSGLCCFKQ